VSQKKFRAYMASQSVKLCHKPRWSELKDRKPEARSQESEAESDSRFQKPCQRSVAEARASTCGIHPRGKLKHTIGRRKNRPGEKRTIFCEKVTKNPDGRKKSKIEPEVEWLQQHFRRHPLSIQPGWAKYARAGTETMVDLPEGLEVKAEP
jgi:hypothetical protein